MPPLDPEQTARVVEIAMDLARAGETAELIDFLDHGFPVDQVDAADNSLLMLAAYHGHHETVAALIARGADVDRRNNHDQSPVAGALFKRSEEHTSELQSLMRTSYAVFCLKKKTNRQHKTT